MFQIKNPCDLQKLNLSILELKENDDAIICFCYAYVVYGFFLSIDFMNNSQHLSNRRKRSTVADVKTLKVNDF